MDQYITIDSMKKARPILENDSLISQTTSLAHHNFEIGSKTDLHNLGRSTPFIAADSEDTNSVHYAPTMQTFGNMKQHSLTQFTLAHLSGKDVLKQMPSKDQSFLTGLINDHLLQNAIAQRQIWKEKYGLTDRQLFELFSEFTAMMVLSR